MKKTLMILIASLATIFACAQNGEILNVVFESDTVTFTGSYPIEDWVEIDLDQDGTEEWLFRGWTSGHQTSELLIYPNVPPYNPGSYNPSELQDRLRLKILTQSQIGNTISDINWGTVPKWIYDVDWTYSDDTIFPHNIMVTRHEVDEGYCYGWIEYTVHFYGNAPDYGAAHVDLIMHQMAYCTIPNYPLRVGQTGFDWSIGEMGSDSFATIHPNPANATITVIGERLRQIEATNMLGQRVATHQIDGTQATIDISALPAGIYIVGITDENGKRCVQKVMKE